MIETIGNSKCQCIMPFERHYILKALEEVIEKENKEIKRVHEGAEKIRESGIAEPEALIEIHERVKRDVEIVKKRTENTPECK